MAREWKCTRCQCNINVCVPDSQRKFLIDGGDIFCGTSCKTAYKLHIPVRLSRDSQPIKRKSKSYKKEQKEKVIFKCFHCNRETHSLTFNKLCSVCEPKMAKENRARIESGEFLTGLVGSLTNEQRSQIRLSKIN